MAENATWGGSMSKVDASELSGLFGDAPVKSDEDFATMPGAAPRLCAAKLWQFRFGPGQWPLPGVGGFVKTDNANATVDMSLVMFPVHEALSQGISLPDIPKFFETPCGIGEFKKSGKVVPLLPGHVTWLPYGWITFPLTWNTMATKTTDDENANEDDGEGAAQQQQQQQQQQAGSDDGPDNVGFIWHLPVLKATLKQQLAPPTWTAIENWNAEHLKKHKSKGAWSARAEIFNSFCGRRQ